MGFRFRRSVTIAKGVRLNFSTRGASLSVLGFNFSPRGVSAGFSVPGTGLSYRSSLTSAARGQRRADAARASLLETESLLQQIERDAAEVNRRLADVRAAVQDDGTVAMTDADQQPLVKREEELCWEQNAAALAGLLENARGRVNGDLEAILNIHLNTPDPRAPLTYRECPFSEPEPAGAFPLPFREPEPELSLPPALGWFARLFAPRRRRHATALLEARLAHEAELLSWTTRREQHLARQEEGWAEHGKAHADWMRRRDEHLANESAACAAYEDQIRRDEGFMAEVLELALGKLQWPRETEVSIAFAQEGRAVLLDVDLPEVEDLPARTAAIAKNGRRLLIKDKAEKTVREEYARHVHGVALRLAGVAFWTLPAVSRVVVSGYSQRLNRAVGKVEDQYLFSAVVDREGFNRIDLGNLRQVDPVEALGSFPIRRKMTVTGLFRPIEPFSAEELTS